MINRERRMEAMQSIGDVSLWMHKPFDWRVRHEGVLIVEGEDDLVPEGYGTNPYCVQDEHWRQLTQGGPLLYLVKDKRHIRWCPISLRFVDIVKHHRQSA
jgi:hypothetical protein